VRNCYVDAYTNAYITYGNLGPTEQYADQYAHRHTNPHSDANTDRYCYTHTYSFPLSLRPGDRRSNGPRHSWSNGRSMAGWAAWMVLLSHYSF